MHPVIISALTEGALTLFNKFVNQPPSQLGDVGDDSETPHPQNWKEAFEQVCAYTERQDEFDKEQTEFIVKLAGQVDSLSLKVSEFEAEMEKARAENGLLAEQAKKAAEAAHQASQKFTLALVFGSFGALISIACIVVLMLKK